MRVNTDGLRQQAWRGEKLMGEMERYAKSIGCTVIHDEIVCNNDEQARKLATWWTENT